MEGEGQSSSPAFLERKEFLLDKYPDAQIHQRLPQTITHGEFELSNTILVPGAPGAKEPEMVFINPAFSLNPATVDIANFLCCLVFQSSEVQAPAPVSFAQVHETYVDAMVAAGAQLLQRTFLLPDGRSITARELFRRLLELEIVIVTMVRMAQLAPEAATSQVVMRADHLVSQLLDGCTETMKML